MFPPNPILVTFITRRQIMNLCQIREIPRPQLALRDAQLMWQFPNRRSPHSHLPPFLDLGLNTERVGTTGIRPHGGKGDLLVGSFLEEEGAVGWAEEEDGEGSVEETLTDVGHEVAYESAQSIKVSDQSRTTFKMYHPVTPAPTHIASCYPHHKPYPDHPRGYTVPPST